MPRPSLQARKEPRQARSVATVESILAAAARVLAGESLAGFNTNRVAEVAGVSVGSLYQYFPNKAALVAALIEREHEQLARALEAAVEAAATRSLDDGLHALARLAIEQQYRDPVYAAALDHEERRLPIATQLAESDARLGRAIMTFLADHSAELPADGLSPEVARDLLLITRALVEADAQDGRRPPESLLPRLVRALRGYLLVPATLPSSAAGRPRRAAQAGRRR
jgi:AcrR family transcriptional regulator